MSKPYDASVKVMVEQHLPDWLALVPRKPRGAVRVIDSDVATVTAAADKVLFVQDPQPWILHAELQAKRDASLEWRVPWYNGILEYKHKCLVHSLVVLLTKEAETPGLTGEWTRQFDGEPPYRIFRYQVVRVWKLHADDLANGSWGLFPLAPLCEDAEALMPGLIQRMGKRLLREYPDVAEAKTLWTITGVLLGLRYEDPFLTLMMKEMLNMIDLDHSLSYQMIVAKGRAEGKAEGKAEGMRETILHQGKKKFGTPDASSLHELNGIADEGRLLELTERILDVDSWQDLLSAPH